MLEWFQSNSLSPQQEQELYALWHEANQVKVEEEYTHDAGRIFGNLKKRLQEPQLPEQEKAGAVLRSLPLQQPQFWLKVAAAVLLPLCLFWGLSKYIISRADVASAAYVTVEAAPGVKKIVNLPDGSVITLNAGSKVSFRDKFAADKREIVLRGEAFFEVAKDSLRPFIVHTGCISTQALGTSFNINYNAYKDAVAVSLATGVVKIDKESKGRKQQITRLVPGQQMTYSKASRQYAVAAFNGREVLGWKEGVLQFKQADIREVIAKLKNWYGVDIEVDTLRLQDETWNYTGEYNNERLEKVLEGIGFVKGFTFRQTDKKIKIEFN